MLDDSGNGGGGSSFLVPPPLVHCSRDSMAELPVATGNRDNRSWTKSSSSVGAHFVGGAASHGDPGGPVDTRRRITNLSKARERAKAPRLVEYFTTAA